MKKLIYFAALVFLFSSWTLPVSFLQECKNESTETVVIKRIDSFEFFIPCANGGLGETVIMTGELINVFHVTENDNGFTVKIHDQPKNLKGVGDVTGDNYVATGAFNRTVNVKVGVVDTIVSTFRIIGQGPRNNLLGDFTLQFTVNANGTVTVSRSNFNLRCQ